MKTYSVTIQAVITKTITVKSDSQDDAYNQAHDLFNPYSGEAEDSHEQITLNVKEVTE
jgi:hypothetical protein